MKAREQEYTDYLNSLFLTYFQPHEFTDYAYYIRRGVENSIPPKALFKNIEETIRLLDNNIRPLFGPTVMLSTYRNVNYNKAVGGAVSSMHLKNNAIDFVCAKGTPQDWYNELLRIRRLGDFKGGVGLYNTFVHVDTRGYNANW